MASTNLLVHRFGGYFRPISLIQVRKYNGYAPEPAHIIPGREPKCVEPKEAFKCLLKSNSKIFVHGAAATPLELIKAMTEVGKEKCLKNIQVYHMHTEGDAPYAKEDCKGIFRSISFFMGGNVRKAVNEGRADNFSIFLHEIPKLFYRKLVVPDIALIHASPPDCHGYSSLGTSIDCVRAALTVAKSIIALINPKMPRTFGDSCIHTSHFDYIVPIDRELPNHTATPPGKEDNEIGKIIAEKLVCDGATLQMGIGTIPDAVLEQLKNHKDLAIHSEMFSDGVVDLVKCGAVTNNLKPHHRGRVVGSFINGTKKVYQFAHDNSNIEMLRVEYVNDVKVICTLPKMTAINSAIEIDLTGQINADSIGTRMFSGFGGQVDFIRGSGDSLDDMGKPIIALQSQTKKKESKIVPILKPGAGVVTSRAHANYIVTEYGIVNLFGKTMRQRAHALINIAHPDHREKLEKAAFERLKTMPCAEP